MIPFSSCEELSSRETRTSIWNNISVIHNLSASHTHEMLDLHWASQVSLIHILTAGCFVVHKALASAQSSPFSLYTSTVASQDFNAESNMLIPLSAVVAPLMSGMCWIENVDGTWVVNEGRYLDVVMGACVCQPGMVSVNDKCYDTLSPSNVTQIIY
mgnify:CR=1 FL=1